MNGPKAATQARKNIDSYLLERTPQPEERLPTLIEEAFLTTPPQEEHLLAVAALATAQSPWLIVAPYIGPEYLVPPAESLTELRNLTSGSATNYPWNQIGCYAKAQLFILYLTQP